MILEPEALRLIDGHYAETDRIIARCHLLKHRGYLTKALVKSHDCIAKQCSFFEKRKPEYWRAREREAQKKRDNRLKRRQVLKQRNERNDLIRETLEDSGHIHVTCIREERPNLLSISYIYEVPIDLSAEVKFLRETLGKRVHLKTCFTTLDTIEELIRKPRRKAGGVTDLRKVPGIGAAAKKRLEALGVFCIEDLFGRDGDALFKLDCERSEDHVNLRYLAAYRNAVQFAKGLIAPYSNPQNKNQISGEGDCLCEQKSAPV